MDSGFVASLLGTAFGATVGGFAAWTALKVEVAESMREAKYAREMARDAQSLANNAHVRISDHVEKHHTKGI